jgi:hypothetical protein
METLDKLISKEQSRNSRLGASMLESFVNQTRSTLSPEFLNNVEQIVARHLESFLAPQTALSVASSIIEDMRGELTDMINDTQDNAIRLVETYTSHFSAQIKNAIKNYNSEICWCLDCHPKHKKEA